MIKQFSALLASLAFFAGAPVTSAAAQTSAAKIKVEYVQTGLTDRRTFGTNTLYWIENDRSLADGTLAQRLRGLGVGMLRFPGGEVADNYDWRINAVDDPAVYPGEPSLDSRVLRTDYREFLNFSDSVGATPNFVVNVEGAWDQGKPTYLSQYVDRASAWVREAADRVQYWEVGNESYHCAGRHSLTVAEYAQSLVEFSVAMKAAASDSPIKIGAIGPFDYDEPGCLDELSPEARAGYRALSYDERKSLDGPGFADRMNARFGGTPPENPPQWWPTVASVASDHFDWVVLHRYDNTRISSGVINYTSTLRIAQTIGRIRSVVAYFKPDPFEIGVTEWNIGTAASKQISALNRAVVIGEQMLQYQKSGAVLMNFWPLRFTSAPSLVNYTNYSFGSMAVVFEAISKEIQDQRIKQTLENASMLETLVTASADGKTTSLFVVNRSSGSKPISIEGVAGSVARSQTLVPISSAPSVAWKSIATTPGATGFSTAVPARSFSVFVFRS